MAAAKAAQATLPQAEVSHPLKDWYTADVENLVPLRAARDAARLVVREQRPNDKQEMAKMREDLRVARARYRTAQQAARQKCKSALGQGPTRGKKLWKCGFKIQKQEDQARLFTGRQKSGRNMFVNTMRDLT